MDRRQFLKTMTAVAAVAATGTLSIEPVQAAVVAPDFNKYKEAIRLFDRAVAQSSNTEECCRRFDELLMFIHKHWEKPTHSTEVLAAAKKLLTTKIDIAGIRGIPPSVADDIYPIALVKMALLEYNLPLLSSKLTMHMWLYENYGWLVIPSKTNTEI